MTDGTRLLWGRLFTRAGDQAWDFALPLTLLGLWPGRLDLASLLYLSIKALGLIFSPKIAGLIDTWPRRSVTQLGLSLQWIGVALSLFGVWWIGAPAKDVFFWMMFSFLVVAGLIGSLGALLMDIAISSDLAPTLFQDEQLLRFNSRFRQVDLFTEVGAPVLAGVLLAMGTTPLAGFMLVAGWNLVSFFPEWMILRAVFRAHPELSQNRIQISEDTRRGFIARFRAGYSLFLEQPAAPVMIAYSFLWLSALSPHGVLLTGFLRDAWRIPEWQIGVFRGAGAVFGLAATLIFPRVYRRVGLLRAAGLFLSFQAASVAIAGGAYWSAGVTGLTVTAVMIFMIAILFSRIGLYGFILGETQVRQERIPVSVRGRVNGLASVINNTATFILLGVAALLPGTADFGWIIALSVGSVVVALLIFLSGQSHLRRGWTT